MSRTRALITRLSFTLRAFLYLALIGAVAYIGFGYTSGYVAVPGDTMLRLNSGQRDVVMFRKVDCDGEAAPNVQGTDDPSAAKPAAPETKAKEMTGRAACAHPPMLALRSLGLGRGGRIGVLVDGDTSINFRRDDKGKSHLTIRKGEQSSEHEFDGEAVPGDIVAKVPEKLRAPLARMVSGADEAAAGAMIAREFDIAVPPPGAPADAMPLPPPAGAGAFQAGLLRGDDGTIVEFRRDIAKDEAELVVRRGDQAKTHKFTGKTVPDAVLNEIPEAMRGQVKEMAAGAGKGAFVARVHPPGGPGLPGGEGDILFLKAPGGPDLAPLVDGAGGFNRVIELPGPALVQQQVLGHTGLRAALVGVTIALVFLAILQLERLLAHFQRAELFSARNSGLMRNLGALLVLVALVQAAGTLMPAILAKTLHPALAGALGPHLLLVFAGFSILLLSAVMAEAGRLEEEAEHTV